LICDCAPVVHVQLEEAERQWIGYYKPNLTIALVDHFQAYPKAAIPPPVSCQPITVDYVDILLPSWWWANVASARGTASAIPGASVAKAEGPLNCLPPVTRVLQVASQLLLNPDGQQYPLVYFDDFWLLRDKLLPMNDTVEVVPLHLAINTYSFWWMQLQQQMDQSFQMQINTGKEMSVASSVVHAALLLVHDCLRYVQAMWLNCLFTSTFVKAAASHKVFCWGIVSLVRTLARARLASLVLSAFLADLATGCCRSGSGW
jgi:hypothetical protein